MSEQTQTITFQINENYSVEIKKYMGSNGEYYNVNGTNYDIHFPIEWVFQRPLNETETETDIPCFGPEECNLCAVYGNYNGVFIGYCLHCAKYAGFKRGNGMLYYGVEIDQEKADDLGIPIQYKEENSMWNVYMQTADLSSIGDEELLNKHKSFFSDRKKSDSDEMENVFDFYGWLNANNPTHLYISEHEDEDAPDLHSVSSENDIDLKSVDSEPENNYTLSLVLPEPEK
jgi:hypothetical protein